MFEDLCYLATSLVTLHCSNFNFTTRKRHCEDESVYMFNLKIDMCTSKSKTHS